MKNRTSGRALNHPLKSTRPRLGVSRNYEELCDEAAKNVLSVCLQSVSHKGHVNLVLTGGGTVRGVYARMASSEYRNSFPWHQIHFFWADDRCVPPDHPRSNYHMVVETLLAKVDVPIENMHPIKTREGTPESAALAYEEEILKHFGGANKKMPSFDLVLLGVGQDGHVASLFPGVPELAETKRLVVPTYYEEMEERRISMTLPLINAADTILFVASGMEKAAIVHEALENPSRDQLPVNRIRPLNGAIRWLVDKGAASLLTSV